MARYHPLRARRQHVTTAADIFLRKTRYKPCHSCVLSPPVSNKGRHPQTAGNVTRPLPWGTLSGKTGH
jgi:hypothetical protein